MKPSIYLLAACAVCAGAAHAQSKRTLRPFAVAQKTKAGAPNNARLPLRDVVLFNSGVGYFGRVGWIRDGASIPLQFRVENINDILKSLVLFDSKGGVRSVTLGSQDSLARRLGQAGFRIDGTLSLGAILRQFQGARVAVIVNGKTILGRILSVSVQTIVERNGATRQIEILNLATSNGLRALPVDALRGVKLLDAALDAKLQSGLKLMAGSFDESKRSVHLNFAGRGVRQVRAGYLQETPVWKTSYRLVLDTNQKPYLQGWAIVENTSDEDWNRVHLSLVSGRPISFTQDLYSPLYVGRAAVAPQVIGSPLSQLYGEAVEQNGVRMDATESRMSELENRTPAPPRTTLTPSILHRSGAASYLDQDGLAALGRRGDIAASALQNVASQAAGATRGELFEYALSNPVTIARQSAAMVPIVSKRIEGTKLSIFDANSSTQNALYGLRLTNTSGMQLAGGPITVFQNGIYAGDAQINTLGRGEHRFVSYAVDLDLAIAREVPVYRRTLTKVRLNSGVLYLTRREQRDITYSFRNKSRAGKTILVVQNIEPDFKLVATQKISEKTADEMRFKVWAPAGATTKFKVSTERPMVEAIAILNADLNFLTSFAVNTEVSPALREALSSLVAKRRRIAELDQKIARLQTQTNEIANDQNRIRQNMGILPEGSDLRKRYLTKLNDQETRLEAMNEELALARDDRAEAQKDLQKFLDTLSSP